MDENKKPLAEWTLGEMKDYCHENVGKGTCWTDCPFGNVCGQLDTSDKYVPGDWDLEEKPRWTAADIEDAKAIARVTEMNWATRIKDGSVVVCDGEQVWIGSAEVSGCRRTYLRKTILPSLKPGETVKLSDIVEAGPC